jgi:hypothetical protein
MTYAFLWGRFFVLVFVDIMRARFRARVQGK